MVFCRFFVLLAVAATGVLSSGATLVAGSFTSANLDDVGTWNTVYAQGFRPSLDASPDPGLSAGAPVSLEQFDFLKSGNADSASDIKLAIVDDLFYDYSVQLTTSSSSFVGISTNTVASTAPIATGDPISFTFNSLSLAYGLDYAAVFVNDDGLGNLTPVLVSALTENYIESPPSSGTYVPATNYGTSNEFQYATSGFLNNGFFSAYGDAADAGFEARFSTIPEPSTIYLAISVVTLALTKRRMRTACQQP